MHQKALTLSLVHRVSFLGPLLIGPDFCRLGTPNRSCNLEMLWPSHLPITVWPLSKWLKSFCLPIFPVSNASTLRTTCSHGRNSNSHLELQSTAGDRLLLWFVTSTPLTHQQGKQLYLAVQCSGKTLSAARLLGALHGMARLDSLCYYGKSQEWHSLLVVLIILCSLWCHIGVFFTFCHLLHMTWIDSLCTRGASTFMDISSYEIMGFVLIQPKHAHLFLRFFIVWWKRTSPRS